jgi:hypothetical protein
MLNEQLLMQVHEACCHGKLTKMWQIIKASSEYSTRISYSDLKQFFVNFSCKFCIESKVIEEEVINPMTCCLLVDIKKAEGLCCCALKKHGKIQEVRIVRQGLPEKDIRLSLLLNNKEAYDPLLKDIDNIARSLGVKVIVFDKEPIWSRASTICTLKVHFAVRPQVYFMSERMWSFKKVKSIK